uniref:MADF domain-containing protein n=1 Tax=Globodera pallida TaxID=36090 RepID=A0A183C2U8_GLOPA
MLFLRDPKHFGGRPLLKEPKKVVEQFKARFNPKHKPEDWKKNPHKDAKLKKWAKEINHICKAMRMAKDENSKGNQQKHSMLYVSNPFVVSGRPFLRAPLMEFLLDCVRTARVRNDIIGAEHLQEFQPLWFCAAFTTANVQMCRGTDEVGIESRGINFGTSEI